MIGQPYNDHECLGSISQLIGEQLRQGDESLLEIAQQHDSTASLAAWIRSLPQRDDRGHPLDGPKVAACAPVQRLRVPAPDPNCVERAALYLGVAELLDPQPVRQLATLETTVGAHTLPLENGAPVILDPSVPRNSVYSALAELDEEEPMPASPRDAAEWTAQLAEVEAQAVRNATSSGARQPTVPLVHQARDAMMRVLDGKAPANRDEVERIVWLLSLAEQAAQRHGVRAMAIVRTTVQMVSELADEAIARAQKVRSASARNLSIEIAGTRLRPAPWASALATLAGRVGVRAGAFAARAKLASMGVPPEVLAIGEQELRSAGLDLGAPNPSAGRWSGNSSLFSLPSLFSSLA